MRSPSFVELHFTPLVGGLKSIEVNFEGYTNALEYGKGIDGSSVYLAPVEKSDILLKPIEETFFRLPWNEHVGRVLCDVYGYAAKIEDYGNEQEYQSSPRSILKRVLKTAEELGYKFRSSSEIEFFLLNPDRSLTDHVGYFSPTPLDAGAKFRRKLIRSLGSLGIKTEYNHHEVATSQHEITLRVDDALTMADNIVTFRYVAANLASNDGYILTMMPKPFVGINGNGAHHHMSLYDRETGKNLFIGDSSDRISQLAKHFVAGILHHMNGIAAIVAPSVNSYKRLVPHYEAPVNKAWGHMNRTTPIRIPGVNSVDSTRVEFRVPDSITNPYLTLAAILIAGLDGIKKKLDPGKSLDGSAFELEEQLESLPATLPQALDELEKDQLFKDVLGEEVMRMYIELKRREWEEFREENEWNPLSITEWEIRRYMSFI